MIFGITCRFRSRNDPATNKFAMRGLPQSQGAQAYRYMATHPVPTRPGKSFREGKDPIISPSLAAGARPLPRLPLPRETLPLRHKSCDSHALLR